MSHMEKNNYDQNIILHVGPHFELEEVKQMKNTNNLNIICCKSSQGKVCSMYNFVMYTLRCNLIKHLKK